MTPPELAPFLAACRRRPGLERVPVWFMRQAGRSLPEYRAVRQGLAMLDSCTRPDVVAEITLQPVRRYGVDAAIFYSDIMVPLKAVGVDLDIVPGVGPVIAHPIRRPVDLAQLRPLESADVGYVSDATQILVAELGDVPLIGFAGAPFTLASYLVEGGPSKDYALTKSLMVSEPALWHELCTRLADISAAFLEVQVRAGASAVQLFDSWAGSLSAEDYGRYVQPYAARVLSRVGELGVPRIHFGVGTSELLGLMGAAGADVVGVDWRLPLAVASRRIGPGYAVQGNLDPALLGAPWPVLADRVRDVLRSGASAPGHVFNLGHGVPPTADPEVLGRIVDLVHAEGATLRRDVETSSRSWSPRDSGADGLLPVSSAVVVGGGIAGLAGARALALSGVDVTVLDAAPRWGGKLSRVVLDDVALDGGAESVLARRPEALELIADLGLAGRLVHPTTAKPQALVGGRVRPLPPSVLGVPHDLDRLAGYLSDAGLVRARVEPELPAPALPGDVAIGRYVDERFGPEVTDRLLEPLLGGVYAGQSRQLSFAAVSPALFERARHGGSLLVHAQQLSAAATAQGSVFAGLVGGISTLVEALVADLTRRGVQLRPGVTVRELQPGGAGGYRLVCGPVPAPELIEANAVLLATPAGPTGRLLTGWAAPAREWGAIPYASTAVVTLAVRGVDLHGSGVLVAPGELPTVKALTYSSLKWDWVAEQAERRWGRGTAVVRASVGRLGEERLLQLDDHALLARTFAEATVLPGWAGATLVGGQVSRWGGALPQYLVGHRELVADLRGALAVRPGLAVCGAALDGVGVAACLGSAARAAAEIVEDLGRVGRSLGSSGPVRLERNPR